jgi:hypothetical protein
MKNLLKLFGIIALVAIIGLSMAACSSSGGGDDDNNNNNNNNNVTDPTKLRVSNEPVTLEEGVPASCDFGYMSGDPLSNFITGTPKAKIANGKLTLELDAPKNTELEDFWELPEGITITPSGAKVFFLQMPFQENGSITNTLNMDGPATGRTSLVYVDKDVKINGTGVDGDDTLIYNNVTLKKGWNYYSYTYSNNEWTFTASQTKPAGVTWKAFHTED